ncbi:DUF397 domain-containing protein [Streptomyces fuscichromogenes]|uniref:DUF397 domain-containing protein n=1 Tax=Streptomyces fuscichromogenes TaxID=1324013 RepID=UPI0037F5C1EE
MSTSDLAWFKSSYSSGSGDNCIEVALSWRKSVYSIGGSGECVDVGTRPATIHIRDSKDRQGPSLALSPSTWADFLAYVAG